MSARPGETPSSTNAPFISTEALYCSLVFNLGCGSTSTGDTFFRKSLGIKQVNYFHLRGLRPPREPPPAASPGLAAGSAQDQWHPAATRLPRLSPEEGSWSPPGSSQAFTMEKIFFPQSDPSDGWGAATGRTGSPTVMF